MGRNSDAKKDFRRALEISPTYLRAHGRIAEVLVVDDNLEAALAELEREEHPAFRLKGLALVNHALKKPSASDAALARLESEFASIAPLSIAEVYAYRGQLEEAFEWLERAIAQKDITTAYIKGNALLRPLLPDPRYPRCLHKMNLAS